jgi:hypothetical protein
VLIDAVGCVEFHRHLGSVDGLRGSRDEIRIVGGMIRNFLFSRISRIPNGTILVRTSLGFVGMLFPKCGWRLVSSRGHFQS